MALGRQQEVEDRCGYQQEREPEHVHRREELQRGLGDDILKNGHELPFDGVYLRGDVPVEGVRDPFTLAGRCPLCKEEQGRRAEIRRRGLEESVIEFSRRPTDSGPIEAGRTGSYESDTNDDVP